MSEHTATTQQARNRPSHNININLDLLDLQILGILQDDTLWKKRITNHIDTVSIQTIGRRVDTLRDNGLLDSCIISPDDIKRDLIIAFETTDRYPLRRMTWHEQPTLNRRPSRSLIIQPNVRTVAYQLR